MQHKERKQFVNFCDQTSFCDRLSSKPSLNLRDCASSLINNGLKNKLSCSSKLSTVRCHRRRWSGGVVGSVWVPEDRHTLPEAHSPVVWKTLRWWCCCFVWWGLCWSCWWRWCCWQCQCCRWLPTWSMSIWLPRFRWDMLDATTGCHSKSGTPCKDMIVKKVTTMRCKICNQLLSFVSCWLENGVLRDANCSVVWRKISLFGRNVKWSHLAHLDFGRPVPCKASEQLDQPIQRRVMITPMQ